MIITEIRPVKKMLSLIYIDGEYAMKLDSAVAAENGIFVGCEIDEEILEELREKSDYKRAKEKALYLLTGRDYTKKQLFDKIKRDSSDEAAEDVCERMEELGLVNDECYGKRLAYDLIYIKKLSVAAAKYKMMQKGIERELCEEILDEFDVDPVEQLIEIIEKSILISLMMKRAGEELFQRYSEWVTAGVILSLLLLSLSIMKNSYI